MTQALAVLETSLTDTRHSSTYTDAENLARHIISRMDSIAVKLRSLEDDIRRLWVEFDNLKDGETILGCATKKEFCEKKLHRTPRAVRYLLNGRPQAEQCSPMEHVHQLRKSAEALRNIDFTTQTWDSLDDIPELVDTCKSVKRLSNQIDESLHSAFSNLTETQPAENVKPESVLCGFCHNLWGTNERCHVCSPDIYKAGTNGVEPEWSDAFPSQVKVGDVLFCVKGKAVPCLLIVGKVTPKRIQTSTDGNTDGFHGNDGFPIHTLKCWTLTAIRVATEDDKRRVAEYELENNKPIELNEDATLTQEPAPQPECATDFKTQYKASVSEDLLDGEPHEDWTVWTVSRPWHPIDRELVEGYGIPLLRRHIEFWAQHVQNPRKLLGLTESSEFAEHQGRTQAEALHNRKELVVPMQWKNADGKLCATTNGVWQNGQVLNRLIRAAASGGGELDAVENETASKPVNGPPTVSVNLFDSFFRKVTVLRHFSGDGEEHVFVQLALEVQKEPITNYEDYQTSELIVAALREASADFLEYAKGLEEVQERSSMEFKEWSARAAL